MLVVCSVCIPRQLFLKFLPQRVAIGEDALANLSIEKTEAGNITGHVRIRSKTQGIALSLGDRITTSQKDGKPPI
jgi:coatomer subunit beta